MLHQPQVLTPNPDFLMNDTQSEHNNNVFNLTTETPAATPKPELHHHQLYQQQDYYRYLDHHSATQQSTAESFYNTAPSPDDSNNNPAWSSNQELEESEIDSIDKNTNQDDSFHDMSADDILDVESVAEDLPIEGENTSESLAPVLQDESESDNPQHHYQWDMGDQQNVSEEEDQSSQEVEFHAVDEDVSLSPQRHQSHSRHAKQGAHQQAQSFERYTDDENSYEVEPDEVSYNSHHSNLEGPSHLPQINTVLQQYSGDSAEEEEYGVTSNPTIGLSRIRPSFSGQEVATITVKEEPTDDVDILERPTSSSSAKSASSSASKRSFRQMESTNHPQPDLYESRHERLKRQRHNDDIELDDEADAYKYEPPHYKRHHHHEHEEQNHEYDFIPPQYNPHQPPQAEELETHPRIKTEDTDYETATAPGPLRNDDEYEDEEDIVIPRSPSYDDEEPRYHPQLPGYDPRDQQYDNHEEFEDETHWAELAPKPRDIDATKLNRNIRTDAGGQFYHSEDEMDVERDNRNDADRESTNLYQSAHGEEEDEYDEPRWEKGVTTVINSPTRPQFSHVTVEEEAESNALPNDDALGDAYRYGEKDAVYLDLEDEPSRRRSSGRRKVYRHRREELEREHERHHHSHYQDEEPFLESRNMYVGDHHEVHSIDEDDDDVQYRQQELYGHFSSPNRRHQRDHHDGYDQSHHHQRQSESGRYPDAGANLELYANGDESEVVYDPRVHDSIRSGDAVFDQMPLKDADEADDLRYDGSLEELATSDMSDNNPSRRRHRDPRSRRELHHEEDERIPSSLPVDEEYNLNHQQSQQTHHQKRRASAATTLSHPDIPSPPVALTHTVSQISTSYPAQTSSQPSIDPAFSHSQASHSHKQQELQQLQNNVSSSNSIYNSTKPEFDSHLQAKLDETKAELDASKEKIYDLQLMVESLTRRLQKAESSSQNMRIDAENLRMENEQLRHALEERNIDDDMTKVQRTRLVDSVKEELEK
jgi:hypothetical protein